MVSMYDHAYFHDHGEVTIPYDGTSIIKLGVLEKIQGPCPFGVPGRCEINLPENYSFADVENIEEHYLSKNSEFIVLL